MPYSHRLSVQMLGQASAKHPIHTVVIERNAVREEEVRRWTRLGTGCARIERIAEAIPNPARTNAVMSGFMAMPWRWAKS
jgi:hypothetical protein